MPDIFLSYSREDQIVARRFAEAFRAEGFDVWWDEALRSGEAYDQVTEKALREAKAVVVLWSRKSVESRWVRAEATQADRNKTLVPAMIEPCDRPIMFELTHTADLSRWRGDTGDKIWLAFLSDVRNFIEKDAPLPASAFPTPGPSISYLQRLVAILKQHPQKLLAAGALIAVLIAAAIWFGAGAGRPAIAGGGTPTVAVLPFDTLGDDALAPFSRSLIDQVTSVMTQNELQTPASDYAGITRKEQLDEVARGGAQFALDGVVQMEGPDLRVNVRLTDLRANRILWAKEYRRAAEQRARFAYQIASHSVDILRCALVTRRPNTRAIPPETQTIFLNACDRVQRFENGGAEMYQAAEQVTKSAPEFSFGWSMLAMVLAQSIGGPDDPEGEAKRRATNEAVDRALLLDPSNGEAYVARALLLPFIGHWGERQKLLDRAISLQPDLSDAYAWQADNLMELGRMKEALALVLRAVEMDRLAPNHWARLVQAYMANGELIKARQLRERLYNDWPDSPAVFEVRFANTMFSGDPAEALELMELFPADALKNPYNQAWMKFLRARQSGRSDELEAAARSIDAIARANFNAIGAALIAHSATGKLDGAFELLELLVARRDQAFAWFLFLPMTAPLRTDLRIVSVFERLGLVDYWRSTGRWPDFCVTEAATQPVCRKMKAGAPR